MCCDGPEYEHLDDNEIVSIVSKSGDDDKQHDEGISKNHQKVQFLIRMPCQKLMTCWNGTDVYQMRH